MDNRILFEVDTYSYTEEEKQSLILLVEKLLKKFRKKSNDKKNKKDFLPKESKFFSDPSTTFDKLIDKDVITPTPICSQLLKEFKQLQKESSEVFREEEDLQFYHSILFILQKVIKHGKINKTG